MISIRNARSTLGLSQAGLANKLGVHQTTISRFETGELPVDERTALALDALIIRAGGQPVPRAPVEQERAA